MENTIKPTEHTDPEETDPSPRDISLPQDKFSLLQISSFAIVHYINSLVEYICIKYGKFEPFDEDPVRITDIL